MERVAGLWRWHTSGHYLDQNCDQNFWSVLLLVLWSVLGLVLWLVLWSVIYSRLRSVLWSKFWPTTGRRLTKDKGWCLFIRYIVTVCTIRCLRSVLTQRGTISFVVWLNFTTERKTDIWSSRGSLGGIGNMVILAALSSLSLEAAVRLALSIRRGFVATLDLCQVYLIHLLSIERADMRR